MTERLAGIVRGALDAAGAPGAAAAVRVNGVPVLQAGFGRAAPDGDPLGADAGFLIYSIAKTLIAATALRLARGGRLVLDAPIRDLVPGAPTTATLRRLLDHTAGVPDYGGLPAYHQDVRARPGHPWTRRRFLAQAAAQGPAFAPGAGWAYSNVGYLLAVLALEAARGRPLAGVLNGELFAPLGLRRTFVARRLRDMARLTPGFSTDLGGEGGAAADVRGRYHPRWVSHGAVASTAPELARLLDAVFGGDLLDAEGRAAMLRAIPVPARHPRFRRPAYGLGVMMDLAGAHGTTVAHGGGGPGYSTGFVHLPHAPGGRVTSVVLANRDVPDLGLTLAFRLAEAVAGDPHPPPVA